jgi:hypothetical protein
MSVDDLQVTQLVKEDVIEGESADGQFGPFLASLCAILLGRLPPAENARACDPGRQRAEGDLAPAVVDVSEDPSADAPIVEMDGAQPLLEVGRQAAQDDADVVFIDVVDAIAGGLVDIETNLGCHACKATHWRARSDRINGGASVGVMPACG